MSKNHDNLLKFKYFIYTRAIKRGTPMSFADTMRIWSDINCTLASITSFTQQRTEGVSAGEATANLFGNLTNGIVRNEMAYMMQQAGNPYGNIVNAAAGYGNSYSNTVGTLALMGGVAPWTFFNCGMIGCGYPMYGAGYPTMNFGCPVIGCGMPMASMPMFGLYGLY